MDDSLKGLVPQPKRSRRRLPAPCQVACPVFTDARGYVTMAGLGKFEEGYLVARGPNPMADTCGEVCSAPCEVACTRGQYDQPVAIRRLKGFLAERYAQEHDGPAEKKPAPTTGKRVAIIGGGAAGIAAAHDLAMLGHGVTLYERFPQLGGTATYGIPRFRLPVETIARDLAHLAALGVEVRTRCAAGQDITLREVRAASDAVFLAAGAMRPGQMEIPGESLRGVYQALSLLQELEMGIVPEIGRRVAVIGGGYTAMDASRTALRLGAEEVVVLYRRSRAEMLVDEEEIRDAQQEGVRFQFLASPVGIEGNADGAVTAISCVRNRLGAPDATGRRQPEAIPASLFTMDVDTVIEAIGQVPDTSFLENGSALRLTSRGTVVADSETLMTSEPGIFAGGDYVTGPRTVIEAVADGRRAARAIDRYLGGEGRQTALPFPELAEFPKSGLYEGKDPVGRRPMPKQPLADRGDLKTRVELGFDEETARIEGQRCLYCGLQPQIVPELCILCEFCVQICPVDCIHPLTIHGYTGQEGAVSKLEWPEIVSEWIDEDICIRCGLCVRYCPTDAIVLDDGLEKVGGEEA